MSSRSNIVFCVIEKVCPCWTCDDVGAHQYLDRVVSERYCHECAGGAIGVDRQLSKIYRKPTKGEVKALKKRINK